MSNTLVVNGRFLTQQVTGVQRFAIEISKLLKRELKGKIQFVAPDHIIDENLARELDVKIVGTKNGHFWEQHELRRYLKTIGNPLLLNLCNTAPLYYRRNIVTVHDLAFEVFPKTYSKLFLAFYKFLIPRIIKRSKAVLTVSEFSKQEILRLYGTPQDKITVIYNSVSDFFHPVHVTELANQKYFAAVSSLNYRKNLHLVLKAFEELQKKDREVSLYIIGGMDHNSFARLDLTQYLNNKKIFFTGRVSDEELRNYYSHAIAFVYPSVYEGFGIPPLEAQKCGVPVIVANKSCLPEVFGPSAVYCEVDDAKSLAQQMENFLLSPVLRSKMIELGSSNTSRYSWEKSADKLITLIEHLAHNNDKR